MATDIFKVTLHMVSSLDGMVAKKDNSVSWFESSSHFDQGIELTKEETEKFLNAIDCYVMGARTYEHSLELSKSYGWPYGNTPTFVISHRKLPIEKMNIEIYSGDLDKFVNEHLRSKYKNVWVVGGPMLAKSFIQLKLVDEIKLSVLPVILGDGISFFKHIGQQHALHLNDVIAYKSGMVELNYAVKK